MLNIQISGTDEVLKRLKSKPAQVRSALLQKVYILTLKLEAHVKNDKLSGQVLNTVSGRLKRSIQSKIVDSGETITGQVFSSKDVPYNAIQEFGGKTSAHLILPNKAKALAFMYEGKMTFARVVHHPGSVIPERSYLRSALADMKPEIIAELTDEVKKALRS